MYVTKKESPRIRRWFACPTLSSNLLHRCICSNCPLPLSASKKCPHSLQPTARCCVQLAAPSSYRFFWFRVVLVIIFSDCFPRFTSLSPTSSAFLCIFLSVCLRERAGRHQRSGTDARRACVPVSDNKDGNRKKKTRVTCYTELVEREGNEERKEEKQRCKRKRANSSSLGGSESTVSTPAHMQSNRRRDMHHCGTKKSTNYKKKYFQLANKQNKTE